jgi:hypothetical protein
MKKDSIHQRISMLGLMIAVAVGLLPFGSATAADSVLYDDSLASPWANWSWGSTVNLAATAPLHGGSRSLSVKINQAWGALYLHTDTPFDTAVYDRLTFWIHGGASGNQRIAIVANGNDAHTQEIVATANAWTQVTIPLSSLGSPATLSDIYWMDATGGPQATFYLDDIALLESATPPQPVAPTLNIDLGAGRHAISDDIYGMNLTDADEALAVELRLPVNRWGGNATTRYNWQTSMTNTGSDWYFENVPSGTVDVPGLPDGSASDQFVEQNLRTGTRSLITLPLIGWTVKPTSPRGHPLDCGFKVSKYGAQQSVDSDWDPDCGNGKHSDNSNVVGNDPHDTSTAVGPGFVADWIDHLVGRYGTAAHGGVSFYNLDNEPMLWNDTHRDVHPLPVTYDELRDLTYQYGPVIKAADPTARTLGPVLWGWCAYFYSALDGCQIGTDYQSHGNLPFVPWYLGQMRDYEQQHGQRILDYLDLHYYPQADGVALGGAGGSATQALRLRSTRSLWDATYLDESWISSGGGVAVQLIPRMRDWVDTWYPNTKLAITEYNWGGLESLNGALAQADVLGIFGREGLDLATLWSPPTTGQPGAFAFRLFRNYDGAGQGFGDTAVQAASTDQGLISVYAAVRGSDQALTVVAINKTAHDLDSPVNVSGWFFPATVAVYRYSAANPNAIEHLPDQTWGASGLNVTLPASSMTLFVLAPDSLCQTGPLTVTSQTFGPGEYSRSSAHSITTQGVVAIEAGAAVGFRAPVIRLARGFRTAAGAVFRARSEAVTCAASNNAQ